MSKRVLVNFADEGYVASQRLNAKTALSVGGIDEARCYGPRDIDPDFRTRCASIFDQPRGAGYWLWKPYFIVKTLEQLSDGDYLFYADSGSYFLRSIDLLIDSAERSDQAIVSFEGLHTEKRWTKRDALVLLDCDEPRFVESPQRMGAFSLWRKSSEASAFAAAWLEISMDERALTDAPSALGLPEYPEFIEHRHDQSLFSLLSKKAGLIPFRPISQLGKMWQRDYPHCSYSQLVRLNRRRRPSLRKRLRWRREAWTHDER